MTIIINNNKEIKIKNEFNRFIQISIPKYK